MAVSANGQLLEVAPDQPYLLHCIGAHLRVIGDPDWEVFTLARRHNFVTGVTLGVMTRLPRRPTLFERKIKEKTYAEAWDGHSATKENYRSVKGRGQKSGHNSWKKQLFTGTTEV